MYALSLKLFFRLVYVMFPFYTFFKAHIFITIATRIASNRIFCIDFRNLRTPFLIQTLLKYLGYVWYSALCHGCQVKGLRSRSKIVTKVVKSNRNLCGDLTSNVPNSPVQRPQLKHLTNNL